MLAPGHYSIVAQGFSLDDLNGNDGFFGPAPTIDTGGGLISFVGGARYSQVASFDYPSIIDDGPSNRYDAGTFTFAAAVTGTADAPVNIIHLTSGEPDTTQVYQATQAKDYFVIDVRSVSAHAEIVGFSVDDDVIVFEHLPDVLPNAISFYSDTSDEVGSHTEYFLDWDVKGTFSTAVGVIAQQADVTASSMVDWDLYRA